MIVCEFVKHPEWYIWHPTGPLELVEDASDEAKKAYQDYLALLKYEDENDATPSRQSPLRCCTGRAS